MPTCRFCDERVSSRDEYCPNCGEDLPRRPRRGERGRSRGDRRRSSGGNKSNTTLIVLAVVGAIVGILICGGLLTALFVPAFQQSREAAQRSASKNNLRQIGKGAHQFHDMNRHFPPFTAWQEKGQGQHSWQTRMLPMVGHHALHQQIQLQQNWNSPNNSAAMRTEVEVFLNPGIADNTKGGNGFGLSHYAANSLLTNAGDGSHLRMRDITDGTANTLYSGEVTDGFRPWGDPNNLRDPSRGIGRGATRFNGPWSGGSHGAHFLFADGSVRFIKQTISPLTLRGIATPNSGEVIGEF